MKENTTKDIDVYSKESTVIERPESYNIGVKVGWTAPAKWWNWLFNACTSRLKELFNTTTSIHNEIKNAVGGTLDPESDTQLKDKLEQMKNDLADMTAQVSANLAALEATKAKPNGIASLDPDGRIPYSQLPESAMEFKGDWDASTNTPTLADGTGDLGDMYFVSVGGTVDLGSGSITFLDCDRVIYNQTGKWEKISGGSVRSVNKARPDDTGDVNVIVDAGHIEDSAVTTAKIADGAVTADKCAGDVVKSVNGSTPTNGNITVDLPSVDQPLSIDKGGTGKTDAKAGFMSLAEGLDLTASPQDYETMIYRNASGTNWSRYTFKEVSNYFKSKILAMSGWITAEMCNSGSSLYLHSLILICNGSSAKAAAKIFLTIFTDTSSDYQDVGVIKLIEDMVKAYGYGGQAVATGSVFPNDKPNEKYLALCAAAFSETSGARRLTVYSEDDSTGINSYSYTAGNIRIFIETVTKIIA